MNKKISILVVLLLFITSISAQEQKTIDSNFETLAKTLKGDYLSNCNSQPFTIDFATSKEKGHHLLQTIDGKQIIWLYSTANTFIKEEGDDYTLNLGSNFQLFTYLNYDNVLCEWTRI